MVTDERWEPDMRAVQREVGWLQNRATQVAPMVANQARAHYEPQIEALRARVAELEQLERVCLGWGGSGQVLAEDILNTTTVGKKMKEKLDGADETHA
jgi:hypothetical protein